ncbi:MAG: D-glycero-alpha-D-manno-heptose-1,7-bisphosphate 7-phosphatase [Bacteroidia bacterium]
MNKAAFFDRDGVLNLEIGDYIKQFNDFKLLHHIYKNLKKLHENGYLLFVITNQGGIAKQQYDHKTLAEMHDFLQEESKKNGFEFTEMYYCPHHPETSACLCRKPGSLMVEKAIAKYNIDPTKSFMIGDKERDVTCANGAGVKGYLIEPNQDFTFIINQEIDHN